MKAIPSLLRRRQIPAAIQMALSLFFATTNHSFAQSNDKQHDQASAQQTSSSATSVSSANTSAVANVDATAISLPSVIIQAQKNRSTLALRGTTLQSLLPGMNPLKGLHQLAGVNFQSADPWGNNEQNFSLFIHGFSAQQLGYTLDGVPLGDQQYGNYNGLSPQRALISENLRNLVLNSGAGDLATASSSNLGGTIESYSSDPRPQTALSFAQTVGSNATSRSFIRYDSGEFGTDLGTDNAGASATEAQSYYLSFARQRAQAWDFEGEQGGEQFNAKWVKHFARAKLSAYYNFSDKAEPNEDSIVHTRLETSAPYTRPTTYPDFEYAKRYLSAKGEPPSQDGSNYRNYFGVAQRRDHLAYLKLESQVDENQTWSNQIYTHHDDGLGAVAGPIGVAGLPNLFKVYFPDQDLKQTFGDSGYAVRTTEYQIHRSGLISTWLTNSDAHQWQAGIWLENNRSSAYRRWYALDAQQPLSPYQGPTHPLITQYGSEIETQLVQFHLQDEWKLNPTLSLQAGLKSSLQFADGRFPVQPKLGAINGGSSALPEGKINTKKWLLPQFGVLWRLADQDQFYLNLQKNLRQFITYGAVGASPWSLNNQSAFDLFKRSAEPETAMNIESGVRGRRQFSSDLTQTTGLTGIEAQFSLYHVNFRDRLLQISPTPVISSIVNGNPVLANVGSVKTQGIDFAVNLQWGAHYSLFNALSYNRSTYQDDYLNGNSIIHTKGKQIPASPNWLNKTMFKANWNAFEWQLMADYVGKRYATYTNDMAVPAHLLFNFSLQYRLPWTWNKGQNRLNFQILNLTQRRGVSTLVVGAANGTYNSFPIAPRQLFLGFSSGF